MPNPPPEDVLSLNSYISKFQARTLWPCLSMTLDWGESATFCMLLCLKEEAGGGG